MKSTCPNCEKVFTYNESRFGDRETVKVRCPACGGIITLTNPGLMVETIPAPPQAAADVPSETTVQTAVQENGETPATGTPKGPPTVKVEREKVAVIEGGEEEEIPPLPANRRISLAVLSGKNSGQVFSCARSRVIVGRTGADIAIDDDEISRRHALLEIHDDKYILKDLGSTNGTFVDERRISETEIGDRGEFRVGGTQLMLIVTPIEDH